MARLDHWKAEELRELASKFRDQAARTKLEKYVELLSHTAKDLEQEAEALERQLRNGDRPGRIVDFYA
ncbi:MAG: hypothetical protein ISS15_07935 [Alphaproteobacteria bacterium]|nr:hypothetical protein [Alphaproteobacteria bacterium]MBL6936801.1 hypothetical protein [Alphaproteobacteria bacterium]MBL7097570.1 hypothetical protein [Alphaproteobacteria bacterium]